MHEALEPHKPPVADKDTGRLESFSDGVFSIALTLLVLDLQVPKVMSNPTAGYLWWALGQQWTHYFAFVTSFATVLIMWINHHGIFRLIRRSSGELLFANGFLLLLVTAVPFPTDLVAQYLKTPAASAACAVYGGLFVVISVAYAWLLIAARRESHLLMPGAEEEADARIRNCFTVGTPLYFLATVCAWFSPWLCLGICSALWLYWAVAGVKNGRAFSR